MIGKSTSNCTYYPRKPRENMTPENGKSYTNIFPDSNDTKKLTINKNNMAICQEI
jgi:hypothetical protein